MTLVFLDVLRRLSSRLRRAPAQVSGQVTAPRRYRRLAKPLSVAWFLIAGIGMTVAPASASVGITPTSAIGLARVANDGYLTVDIQVCATFDQPVRFIEALVEFSDPHMLGVAVYGPGSGAVTKWCGTYTGISAAFVPPGTDVAMDIRWSAHNGNGLSEGHAHGTGNVQLPGPPPNPPKKTPQQAADLGHASNALAEAAAIIAVAAVVVGVAALVFATGGALVPLAFGILGGVAGIMAIRLNDIAIDPPDPDYKVTVVAHNLPLPTITAGDGISAEAAAALNALIAVQADETGQAGAMVAALYKAQGASAANDVAWNRTQTLAAAAFAHQLAVDLNSEPPLRTAARRALESGGYPVIAVTPQQASDQLGAWDSLGLPAVLKNVLTLDGVPSSVGDELHIIAHSLATSAFAQKNFLDLLAPASPEMGPNLIEAANAQAAAALLAWSDALKANPTGPPPPTPPIITSVQPNQGVAAGGTTVNIFGTNLLSTTQINFGTSSTSNGSCSDTQCTAYSPAGTGTVDVTATGPGGTSAVTAADRFSYFTGVPGSVHLPANTILANGGFDPPGPESELSFDTLVGSAGAPKLGGHWEILAGSIDLVGPYSAQAAEGVQFIDLNGNDPSGGGTISQQISTIPGHQYKLSFWLAGNPNGDPAVKTLTASIGAVSQDFSFDTTGHTNIDLGWVEKDLQSLICTTTTRVTLKTTTPGERGPNIDAVSVVDLGLAPAGSCIAPGNHPPVAKDQTVNTSEDAATPIILIATDQDSDPLKYSIVSGPQHGTLSGTAPNLIYTPASGYTGTDTFAFIANDGHANSNMAAVKITIGVPPTVLSFHVLFGSQSYNLAAYPRTRLPWTITGIQVTFSKVIESGNASSLTGAATTGFSGLGTKTLTWTVNPLSQGNLSIMLSGSGPNALSDADGNFLNGGSGSVQLLKILTGDFNDDGVVSAADLVGVNSSAMAPFNIFADLNGDGVVNMSDVQIVRTKVGTSLP